jgi:hypothetical protein
MQCFEKRESETIKVEVGLNSQIHANRADSENWILFQFKTA